MADDLVCRRVKECCVCLHSCVQRWNQLNSLGLGVATKLVNILMRSKCVWITLNYNSVRSILILLNHFRYTESESGYGVLQGDAELASSLEGKMMMERESLYAELLGIKTDMVRTLKLKMLLLSISSEFLDISV